MERKEWLEKIDIGPIRRWCGPVLFFVALIVFFTTLSPGPFPEFPASIHARNLGMGAVPPQSNPLYGLLVLGIDAVASEHLVGILNGFSAVCGAGCVWLLYVIVAGIPHNRTNEERNTGESRPVAEWVSGLVAALFFAFCLPLWVVSNRAHVLSFGLLILLLNVFFLLRYYATGKTRWIFTFALAFGIGVPEFSTFIVASPFFALILLGCIPRLKAMGWKRLILLVPTALIGFSLYVIWAARYVELPRFSWTGQEGMFDVIWLMWREQYLMALKSMPRVGWVVIGLVSLVPWVIVLMPKQTPYKMRYTSIFLHLLLTGLGLGILFNAKHISPWTFFGYAYVLVTPYVLIATWFGYLAGYWLMLIAHRSPYKNSLMNRLRVVLLPIYGPLCLAVLITAAVMNRSKANAKLAGPVITFSEAVVDSLEGRTWLVATGLLHESLFMAARKRGIELVLIDSRMNQKQVDRMILADHCEDPVLRDALTNGVPAFIKTWMKTDPEGISARMA
ncbi:MAG: DUF2723 domain-containing protein, partial [Verrucomicrobiota bacterium]